MGPVVASITILFIMHHQNISFDIVVIMNRSQIEKDKRNGEFSWRRDSILHLEEEGTIYFHAKKISSVFNIQIAD